MSALSATTRSRPAGAALADRLAAVAARLGAADPRPLLGGLLDDAFPLPVGDCRYGVNALLPGALPLELSFAETEPASLRLDCEPFPGLAPAARARRAKAAVRSLVDLDSGTRPASGQRFGAFLGLSVDAAGLREAKVYYELDAPAACVLPAQLRAAYADAGRCVPGLVPHLLSVAGGRDGVKRRLYLRCAGGLRLLDLEPLLSAHGLGHRLPALVLALRELAGGRFALPPDAAVIGLRPLPSGLELKLDLLSSPRLGPPGPDLDAADRMLVERPVSRAALRRWRDAVGGDVDATVVGVRVSPERGPCLNVYVRPPALEPSA